MSKDKYASIFSKSNGGYCICLISFKYFSQHRVISTIWLTIIKSHVAQLRPYLIHKNSEIHIFSSSVISGSEDFHKAFVTGQTTDKKSSSKSDSIPTPGIEPRPRRWERRILTTRPRGTSWCDMTIILLMLLWAVHTKRLYVRHAKYLLVTW